MTLGHFVIHTVLTIIVWELIKAAYWWLIGRLDALEAEAELDAEADALYRRQLAAAATTHDSYPHY